MKTLKKYKVWRGVSVVLLLLLAIFIVISYLGWYYSGYVNDFFGITAGTTETTDFESRYGALNEENCKKLQADEDALNIQAMEEGAVLLKNKNNALPLASTERSVTFFGNSTANPIYAAGGGSAFKASRGGTLYDSFKSAGFEINDTMFNAYANSGVRRVSAQTVGNSSIGEVDISFYTDALKSSWADKYNDVAIVLFTRYGGEGIDLDVKDADGVPMLSLHKQEADLLRMIKSSGKFGKTVVLLNSPFAMNLDWLDDDTYGVDACMTFGGTGDTGFIGVTNLLTGKADFSGHTVDTWAADALSAPAMQNFGDFEYANHNKGFENSYVVYAEDIYVGYKYYETRYQDQAFGGLNGSTGNCGVFNSPDGKWDYASEMGRPYGYGLSYSRFTQEVKSIEWDQDAHTVTASVLVTNNGPADGSSYSGKAKSVVQLYAQCPYSAGQAEKPAVQLIGFAKSSALGKGESETVAVTADDYLFATYDETAANGADTSKKGCYVYDAGNYYFAIGDSSHDALNNIIAQRISSGDLPAGAVSDKVSLTDEQGASVSGEASKSVLVKLDAYNNTWQAKSATGEVVCNTLQDMDYNSYNAGEKVTYLTRSDWSTFPKSYTGLTTNAAMDTLLAGKTYKSNGTPTSAFTQDVDSGLEFADMKNVPYEDDETWNKFLDQLSITELATICGESRGNKAITSVGKPVNSNTNGPYGLTASYKYGDGTGITLYVDEVIMACTYNTELLAQRGAFFAEDALYSGYSMIFGPGANLHRTPYGGRNSEYYSEDGNMSYLCGAAQTKAMTKGGFIAGIKHFAGNDQETNRHGVSTFATEQGFRQGSLRGFEGALRDDVGECLGVMACFNRIGLVAGSSCYATQVQILRKEWGFKGVVITDAAKDTAGYVFTEESITCGTDMYDGDESRTDALIKLIKTGKDGNILDAVRTANKHFYYAYSRSNLVNGLASGATVSNSTPWWKSTLIAIDVIVGILALAAIVLFILGGYMFTDNAGNTDKKEEEAGNDQQNV
ncbi:MAG: glycoside hydrolase family 3 C-terminal domain-containing protein [Clostridia bacterium]|nr:glycoside hydrolase family 3 C-terminal domain-containing protein [Clostridia bacterium]